MAAGGVDPRPEHERTCVCEKGDPARCSASDWWPHVGGSGGPLVAPRGGGRGGPRGRAAGTRGRLRKAPPRPLSPALAGGMPRGHRTLTGALP